jgi:hypothetical protein
MIPLNQFLPVALAEVLRKAPLTTEKVAFAWRQAVGTGVDRVTAIELDGHVLRVKAQDAQWQREVERSAHLICSRLEALLGENVVKRLDITVG